LPGRSLAFLYARRAIFAVTYSINPWMDPQAWAEWWRALHSAAGRQWTDLRRALLAAGAGIESCSIPQDQFTAI
jgi:hypothetical protein